MITKFSYNKTQLTFLVILRVLIGWHFLYEGLAKLVNPDWSSAGFLLDSKGLLAPLFHSMASSPDLLNIVDFLNIWGLILIGLGLILGLFSGISVVAGIVLLGMYYLSHPPCAGFNYSVPSEGSYLWVNKNLVEMAALAVLLVFPTGRRIGLDRFIFNRKKYG